MWNKILKLNLKPITRIQSSHIYDVHTCRCAHLHNIADTKQGLRTLPRILVYPDDNEVENLAYQEASPPQMRLSKQKRVGTEVRYPFLWLRLVQTNFIPEITSLLLLLIGRLQLTPCGGCLTGGTDMPFQADATG